MLREMRRLAQKAVSARTIMTAAHAGSRVEEGPLVVGFDAIGSETGSVVAGEAKVSIGHAADTAVPAAGSSVMFDDQGPGSYGRGEAAGTARRTGGTFGPGSCSQLALEPELLHACPIACFPGCLALPATFFTLFDLLTPYLSNLVQCFHVLFPSCLFLLGRFGEFNDRVHASPLAFPSNESFRRAQGGIVGRQGDDAANGGITVDAICSGGDFGGPSCGRFGACEGRIIRSVAGVQTA